MFRGTLGNWIRFGSRGEALWHKSRRLKSPPVLGRRPRSASAFHARTSLQEQFRWSELRRPWPNSGPRTIPTPRRVPGAWDRHAAPGGDRGPPRDAPQLDIPSPVQWPGTQERARGSIRPSLRVGGNWGALLLVVDALAPARLALARRLGVESESQLLAKSSMIIQHRGLLSLASVALILPLHARAADPTRSLKRTAAFVSRSLQAVTSPTRLDYEYRKRGSLDASSASLLVAVAAKTRAGGRDVKVFASRPPAHGIARREGPLPEVTVCFSISSTRSARDENRLTGVRSTTPPRASA